MGSEGSAAGGGKSDLSEWPRSADEEAAPSATKMPGTANGERRERRQWRMKRPERVAAVDEGRRLFYAEDIRRVPQQEKPIITAQGITPAGVMGSDGSAACGG